MTAEAPPLPTPTPHHSSPISIHHSLVSDQTSKSSLLKKGFSKEQPCHKLTQSTGLSSDLTPGKRGLEDHFIFWDFYPHIHQLQQPLFGSCGKTCHVQNPMTSIKTPASLYRSECNRLVWWEPLSFGVSKVLTPSKVFHHACSNQSNPTKEPALPSCLTSRQDLPNCLSLLVSDLRLPETSYTKQLDHLFRRASEQRHLPHQGSRVCWMRRGWGEGRS